MHIVRRRFCARAFTVAQLPYVEWPLSITEYLPLLKIANKATRTAPFYVMAEVCRNCRTGRVFSNDNCLTMPDVYSAHHVLRDGGLLYVFVVVGLFASSSRFILVLAGGPFHDLSRSTLEKRLLPVPFCIIFLNKIQSLDLI